MTELEELKLELENSRVKTDIFRSMTRVLEQKYSEVLKENAELKEKIRELQQK